MATRKTFLGLLATALIWSMLAACSSQSSDKPGGASSGQTAAAGNGQPITITTAACSVGTEKLKAGETLEDNVTTRWAKEKLGIQIKYLWTTSQEQCSTKLRLALTSNEPLPDVMFTYDFDLVSSLIEAGKLLDVREAFDKLASPEFKKSLEDPLLWAKVMKDGGRYAIPILEFKYQNEPVLWLREDWLNKFNLKPPATLDDLETVMDAFVNRDPDGNGQKDTVGISAGLGSGYNNFMSDVSWVFGAYGAMPGYFIKDAGGNLTYGSTVAGAKEGLLRLRSWVEKGYIHREALTQDAVKSAELMNTGHSGALAGPYWQLEWPIQDVAKNSPGAVVKPYTLPSGPDGKVGRRGADIDNSFLIVNKDFKHLDALFKYLNKLYEGQNKLPGGEFEYGFFEGYDYKLVDGKPVYNDKDRIDITRNFMTPPPRDPELQVSTLKALYEGKQPETPNELLEAGSSTPLKREAAALTYSLKDTSVYNLNKGAPTETMKLKWEYLTKMEKEYYAKFVMGEVAVDSFDQFVADWNKAGGQQVIREVNERYQAQIAQ